MYLTNRYIGIPFKWHGCSVEGCDCWGLVRLVELELFNVFLPTLVGLNVAISSVTDIIPYVTKGLNELPLQVTGSPVDGDIVLMSFRGAACHVGVYVNGGILHSDPLLADTSRFVRLSEPRIASRIEGFYRVV